MSKAQKIRDLYESGLGTRQIADKVGCKIEYVRVVARQRSTARPYGASEIEVRYLMKKYEAASLREANTKKMRDLRSRRGATT